MGFRTQPAGVVYGEIGEGTLNLPAAYELVQGLAVEAAEVHRDEPLHAGQDALDNHYRDRRALVMAIAEVLRRQVAAIDAGVLQVDEANLPGSPRGRGVGGRGDQRRAERRP